MLTSDFNLEKETEILSWLEKEVGFENFGNAIERGLDRIRPLFQKYLKQWDGKIITIAGTNGKGETVLYLSEIFKNKQKTFSTWMSPHILTIQERFRNEEGSISYTELEQLFAEIKKEEQDNNIKLSFYEFLFLAFIKNALKRKSEYLILEVGLGGRLDAVNLFDAEFVGLTSLGRDHQKFLGNSLKEILKEKLGVIRSCKLIFTAFSSVYLRFEAKRIAFEHFSFLVDLEEAQIIDKDDSYSLRNFKMAKMLAQEALGEIDLDDICLNRFPIVNTGHVELHFINAQNPEGFRFLVKEICQQSAQYDGILMAFSQRSEKDLETMIKSLLAYAGNNDKLYLSPYSGLKALSVEQTKSLCEKYSLKWVQDWKSFLNSEEVKDKKFLVTGSNYFIGNLYQYYHSL